MILDTVLTIGLIAIALAIAGCFYRVAVGPSIADRIVALDTIGISVIGLISLFSIKQKTLIYLDVILVIAVLAFVGTVATAKFIEKGVIIDRDHH